MTSIKMLLSYNNNEKIVQLPVVPDTLPSFLQEIENSTLTTHTTTLTLLGSKKPRSFSLDLFLPTRDYEFCKGNGLEVIEFLEYVSSAKIPARLVIVDNLTEILNIAIAINSYKYNYDTVKNIRATIECSEYIFLTEPKKETTTSVPVFSNITVYYNNKAARVSSANVNGSNLVKTRDIVMLLGRDLTWNADKKELAVERFCLIFTQKFMTEMLIHISGILHLF